MPQISRLSDLQDRKRALVAESEVYRQTLRLEVQNIRMYGASVRRKFAWMRLANPLFLLAGSYLGSRLLGRKLRSGTRGGWSWLGVALMAWRVVRSFGPSLQETVAGLWRGTAGGEKTSPGKEGTPKSAAGVSGSLDRQSSG